MESRNSILKKETKRILSLFLVIAALLMLLPIGAMAARGENVIPALNYSSTTGVQGSHFTRRDGFMDIRNCEFTYTVDIEKAGDYLFSVDCQAASDDICLEMFVNGESIGEINIKTKSARKDHTANVWHMNKGVNTITLKSVKGIIYFYNIKFEKSNYIAYNFTKESGPYKNFAIPCDIEAEDFDIASLVSSVSASEKEEKYRDDAMHALEKSGTATLLRLGAGDSVEYTFNVPVSATYSLKLFTEADGRIRIYYDKNKGYLLADALSFSENDGGTVYLETGKHTLKLEAEDEVSIDYISFKKGVGDYVNPLELTEGKCVDLKIPETENTVYREFYVSTGGNKEGDGSKENPFDSIETAKKAVSEISQNMTGDIIVNILPGRYVIDETIVFTEHDSGKNGYDIIYRGTSEDEKPIIDGGIKIDGWKKDANGIYSAKAEGIDEMRTLYINGYSAQRAISKYFYYHTKNYDDPETEYRIDGFYVSKRNFPILSKTEDVETIHVSRWSANRNPIAEIKDAGDEWLFIYDQPWFYYLDTQRTSAAFCSSELWAYFVVENAPELLDEPGEFYFDKDTKTVYYYPFPEENMETAEVYTGKVEGLMTLIGNDKDSRIEHIVFDGIEFRHGAWNRATQTGYSSYQADMLNPAFDYSTIPDLNHLSTLHYSETMHAQIKMQHIDYIDFKNCEFINLGSAALAMDEDAHHSDIVGNIFRDISGTAVIVGNGRHRENEVHTDELTSRITISNNLIRRIGIEYQSCPAIGVYYAESVHILNNDIEDTPYTAISLGWGWKNPPSAALKCYNHKVMYNRINRNGHVARDGGPIYTLSRMDNTEIAYNYLSNSPDFAGGVYHDSGSQYISTHHNVAENGKAIIFAATLVTDIYSNYGNFVDQELAQYSWEGKKEIPRRTDGDNWSPEAREIMAGAGLSEEYKHLPTKGEYPDWRTEWLSNTRKITHTPFENDRYITIESTGFIKGGYDVAYHFENCGTGLLNDITVLDESVLGNSTDGDWIKYNVDVKESGMYHVIMRYCLVRGKDANVTAESGFNLYIDGKKMIDAFVLPSTSESSWYDYNSLELEEEFEIEAGTHEVMLEFSKGGFAYDEMVLAKGDKLNDAEFDDGNSSKIKIGE